MFQINQSFLDLLEDKYYNGKIPEMQVKKYQQEIIDTINKIEKINKNGKDTDYYGMNCGYNTQNEFMIIKFDKNKRGKYMSTKYAPIINVIPNHVFQSIEIKPLPVLLENKNPYSTMLIAQSWILRYESINLLEQLKNNFALADLILQVFKLENSICSYDVYVQEKSSFIGLIKDLQKNIQKFTNKEMEQEEFEAVNEKIQGIILVNSEEKLEKLEEEFFFYINIIKSFFCKCKRMEARYIPEIEKEYIEYIKIIQESGYIHFTKIDNYNRKKSIFAANQIIKEFENMSNSDQSFSHEESKKYTNLSNYLNQKDVKGKKYILELLEKIEQELESESSVPINHIKFFNNEDLTTETIKAMLESILIAELTSPES